MLMLKSVLSLLHSWPVLTQLTLRSYIHQPSANILVSCNWNCIPPDCLVVGSSLSFSSNIPSPEGLLWLSDLKQPLPSHSALRCPAVFSSQLLPLPKISLFVLFIVGGRSPTGIQVPPRRQNLICFVISLSTAIPGPGYAQKISATWIYLNHCLSSGCHDKTPQAGWLKQETLLPHCSERWAGPRWRC